MLKNVLNMFKMCESLWKYAYCVYFLSDDAYFMHVICIKTYKYTLVWVIRCTQTYKCCKMELNMFEMD